ncbi:MAG: hypothetical protein M3220_03455 [Chloroflexota bacterium]|nr:hypothetical protein [Chloroflexota bacterium]
MALNNLVLTIIVGVLLLAMGLSFWISNVSAPNLGLEEREDELAVRDATPTESARAASDQSSVSRRENTASVKSIAKVTTTRAEPVAHSNTPSPTPVTPSATPLATATSKPTATPTPPASPTAIPTVEPTATPVPPTSTPSPSEMLEQVASAQAALQTGQFEMTIDFEDGNRSSAQVLFDLASEAEGPRLWMTTTYEGSTGTQTSELVMIGNQSWQRQGDGEWSPRTNQESVWGQVQSFLPHTRSVTEAELDQTDNATVVHWYDAGRAMDVTLYIHPETSVPKELHEVRQHGTLTRTVVYSIWNEPVEIAPPMTN